jgi:hypothetical protein
MQTALMLMTIFLGATTRQSVIPSALIGHWVVGVPYDVGQPIGLNADQEEKMKNLPIVVTRGDIAVCGKTVSVESVSVEVLSSDQFLARYNFSADRIGLRGSHITDVTINKFHSTYACGDFNDPGTHLFVSAKEVVMEVGNDYFPLRALKQRP